MKIKTSELIGAALDWAVAKCEGNEIAIRKGFLWIPTECYSTDWSQGGSIIKREKIGTFWNQGREEWQSYPIKPQPSHYGPTPLIAAMRCFVTSKLGDEVDVPEELI
jgi:hypothetical protein